VNSYFSSCNILDNFADFQEQESKSGYSLTYRCKSSELHGEIDADDDARVRFQEVVAPEIEVPLFKGIV